MKIQGKDYKTIWLDGDTIKAINQKKLPFIFEIAEWMIWEQAYEAIKDMTVRGAPLIGAAGAGALFLASLQYKSKEEFYKIAETIRRARPTAVNLSWAVDYALKFADFSSKDALINSLRKRFLEIVSIEESNSNEIANHGVSIIKEIYAKINRPVKILTHCNAGWLAAIDYGTALAPVFKAVEQNIPVFVWVDETRPRNQGARLTAFELSENNIPHAIIPDNTGGLLAMKGEIDLMIVGCDRMTSNGDAVNKIGTYLKALAAKDNNIPFCVALPSSSIDWTIDDYNDIEIETRDQNEVKKVEGYYNNELIEIDCSNPASEAINYGFDITPARLIDYVITEKGISKANKNDLMSLFS